MKKKVYLFDAVLNQYQEEDEGTMFIENIKLVPGMLKFENH